MKHKIGMIIDNKDYYGEYTVFSDGAGSLKMPLTQPKRYLSLAIPTSLPVDSVYSLLIQFNHLVMGYDKTKFKMMLHLPYYPYGRADRVFEDGMVNPREAFTDFAKSIGFYEITTDDIHSDEDGVISLPPNKPLGLLSIRYDSDTLLVAPDKGAVERVKVIADKMGMDYITCEKQRNVSNGWITGYSVVGDTDLSGRTCLIIDDICDGGKTFELCANSLRELGAKSVSLYVTHGIFSKGLDIFKGVLDNVHCQYIVRDYISEQDLKLFNGGN